MLGKLYKYEMKATSRYFLLLFAAVLVMSLFNGVFQRFAINGPDWLEGMLMTIEVLLMVALGIMTFIVTVQRFYKNLLGNEGYLMFTLPVSTNQNIMAKLLAALSWYVASMLIICFSLAIMFLRIPDFQAFLQEFLWMIQMSEVAVVPVIIEGILILLVVGAANILFLYLAMAIGQLFNEHKFMASFGAYIIMMIALQILATICAVIFGNTFDWWSFERWLSTLSPNVAAQFVMLGTLLISSIVTGVIYFFTNHLLKNRLNLT